LVKEGSAQLADAVQHPFTAARTPRVALRNHALPPLVIEEGGAEMGASYINR
jgi:hypothetical protein